VKRVRLTTALSHRLPACLPTRSKPDGGENALQSVNFDSDVQTSEMLRKNL
jgi:hypothetical protein